MSATAPPIRALAEVEGNEAEGGANRRLRLRVEGWPGFEPGQFVMLSAGACGAVERLDPLLPRPMAVYRDTRGNGGAAEGDARIEILYKVTGRGTALLADAKPGEGIRLVGPLGRAFPEPPPGARAILVGGGTGIASLFALAARTCAHGEVRVLLGARSAADLMGQRDFQGIDAELRIATEDGSDGRRGLVTELLEDELADRQEAVVYACGPTAMMERAAGIAARHGRPASVSLENVMACGFGVCLGCAAPRRDGTVALVCCDGPVFAASEIDWERLG